MVFRSVRAEQFGLQHAERFTAEGMSQCGGIGAEFN